MTSCDSQDESPQASNNGSNNHSMIKHDKAQTFEPGLCLPTEAPSSGQRVSSLPVFTRSRSRPGVPIARNILLTGCATVGPIIVVPCIVAIEAAAVRIYPRRLLRKRSRYSAKRQCGCKRDKQSPFLHLHLLVLSIALTWQRTGTDMDAHVAKW